VKAPPEQELLALTQEMLSSAQAGDWDRLVELEQTRLPVFHLVFDQGIVGREDLAREILAMDENTMALAKSALPVIKQALLKLRTSGKANTAYQTIQNSTSSTG
jgi:hypothetical protein